MVVKHSKAESAPHSPIVTMSPAAADPSQHGYEPPKKKVKNDSPPPAYGTQEYWDARYKTVQALESDADQVEGDGEALPYHAWYFTYTDLRPIILPLILGGKTAGQIDPDLFDGESDQFEVTEQDANPNKEGEQPTAADDKKERAEDVASDGEERDGDENDDENDDEDDEDGENDENNEDDDGEFVEVEEDEEDDEDDDGDEPQEREGVAKDGPVSVLEIGCGDVPLGKDLAIELISLEKSGNTKVDAVIKKIVCCDYSPTVVAMLNKQKQEAEGLESEDLATLDTILDYQTVDARKMPQYKDKSFEIVLEKGTLDAMLSDKEVGVINCQAIMTESARVLTIGGFIVLISHLNAHTKNGIEWLHEVVLPGLRAGDTDARWEIEVHGNDGMDDMEDGNSIPSGSPGPCVYVIKKLETPAEEDHASKSADPPTIPLKFFTY